MDVGVTTAVVGGVVSVITGVVGYLSGRGKDKVTERELLSKDEQAFRAELREELCTYKEDIKRLSDEITVLRKENNELINENRLLNFKVEQLVSQLSKRIGDRRWDDAEVPKKDVSKR
jgi:cell division protein FtsB